MPLNVIFYQVVRIFLKGGTEPMRSVQFYNDYGEAEKRFYAIIAADINDPLVTYHGTYIIDSTGITLERKVFDRRSFEPEPEPEPEIPQETQEPEE